MSFSKLKTQGASLNIRNLMKCPKPLFCTKKIGEKTGVKDLEERLSISELECNWFLLIKCIDFDNYGYRGVCLRGIGEAGVIEMRSLWVLTGDPCMCTWGPQFFWNKNCCITICYRPAKGRDNVLGSVHPSVCLSVLPSVHLFILALLAKSFDLWPVWHICLCVCNQWT